MVFLLIVCMTGVASNSSVPSCQYPVKFTSKEACLFVQAQEKGLLDNLPWSTYQSKCLGVPEGTIIK